MKDYYAVLGVLPSIEQSALKAVYSALMKKYHPDVTTMPKQEAELRTKEINEAYTVLGDLVRRAKYDEQRKHSSSGSGDYDQESSNSDAAENSDPLLQKDWQIVVSYFPEAEECRVRLRKISVPLSETFQIVLISEKMARQAKEISELLQKEFLKTYFGSNEKLHPFVLFLIRSNAKKVLLEINNYTRVIGAPPDNEVDAFVASLIIKFKIENYGRSIRKEDLQMLSLAFIERENKNELGGLEHRRIYLAALLDSKVVGWNSHTGQYQFYHSLDEFFRETKFVQGRFNVTRNDSDLSQFLAMVGHLKIQKP